MNTLFSQARQASCPTSNKGVLTIMVSFDQAKEFITMADGNTSLGSYHIVSSNQAKESTTMGTIHVNTDMMRQLGRLFVQLNEQIATQLEPQIQHLTSELESDWIGVSRQHFEQALNEWRATANRLAANGEDLGRHLEATATRFDNADQF